MDNLINIRINKAKSDALKEVDSLMQKLAEIKAELKSSADDGVYFPAINSRALESELVKIEELETFKNRLKNKFFYDELDERLVINGKLFDLPRDMVLELTKAFRLI